MVFVGYEPGTKGYRVYDPVGKKLHISRDVIFEESRAWDWNAEAQTNTAALGFEVEHYTIAGPGTVTEFGNAEEMAEGEDPFGAASAGPHSPGQWSAAHSNNSPNQPTPQGSPATPATEFASPPAGETVDLEGVPLRFWSLQNIFDTTDEIHGFEYSGLCYLATEEPGSVDEALGEQCWREAMKAKMESIQSNKTWELADLPAGHRAIGLKCNQAQSKVSCKGLCST
jgi:hypothetical protein